MEIKLRAMQKSAKRLGGIFKVLSIAAAIFLLWMLAGWIFGLFCPQPQMEAAAAASGGWSVSAGPFSVLIRQGYFAPSAEPAVKAAYLIESSMNLLGGACQWTVLFLAFLLFDAARENPFTEKSGRYLRRMGVLLCLGGVLPSVGKTVLFGTFAGGIWSFFPDGLPVGAVLSGMVFWAAAGIFDYGALLQKEHDETL